jgi:hypothetical protein
VGGVKFDVNLPEKGSGVRGVLIADPCYSAKYAGCDWGQIWGTFNHTAEMFNALAARKDVDFFAILGDNFYDQDGRVTEALWRTLSIVRCEKFDEAFAVRVRKTLKWPKLRQFCE